MLLLLKWIVVLVLFGMLGVGFFKLGGCSKRIVVVCWMFGIIFVCSGYGMVKLNLVIYDMVGVYRIYLCFEFLWINMR